MPGRSDRAGAQIRRRAGRGYATAGYSSSPIPVRAASRVADSIATGNLDTAIEMKSSGELGQLLDALGTMQINLREQLERERTTARENRRIREALDNVDSSVVIVDMDHNIVYLNDAMADMLLAAQDDIRKDLPDFDVDTLMGRSIDMFFDDSAHLRGELDVFV